MSITLFKPITFKYCLIRCVIYGLIVLFGVSLWALFTHWQTLMQLSVSWQRSLHQLLGELLGQTTVAPTRAGLLLVAISFAYGVFHALGPGHGKVIISTYIATHPLRLRKSLVLTLCASLLQGVMAIGLVSAVLGLLHLSSKYLHQSSLWLEKMSYGLVIVLGVMILIRGLRQLLKQRAKDKQPPLTIHAITPIKQYNFEKHGIVKRGIVKHGIVKDSAVLSSLNMNNRHQGRHDPCSCGHKHTLSDQELQGNWQSLIFVIITMGIRPCSGAILVLLFASLLNVYVWGVVAALAMALGTSLTISIIAILVHYVRQRILKLSASYHTSHYVSALLMLLGGGLLVVIGLIMYQAADSVTPLFLYR